MRKRRANSELPKPRRPGAGWVMWDAKKRLDGIRSAEDSGRFASVRKRWRRADSRAKWFLAIAGALALQAISYGLTKWPFSFWPSLAPAHPNTLQNNLWVVAAAIVGVSLPVFVVVVQFAGSASEDVAALPLTEVLRRKSKIDRTLVISGLAVVHCGADALWFQGQAVLLFDYFVGVVAVVAALGGSYWSLFRLVRSRAELKASAFAMLEEKLDVAIDDSWVPAEANANLIEQLAGHHVQYSPFGLAYQAAPWTSIGPLEDKVVRDVDVGGLSAFLDWLRSPSIGGEPTQPEQVGESRQPEVVLLRVCGMTIGPTQPLLAYLAAGQPTRSAEELWEAVGGYVDLGATDD